MAASIRTCVVLLATLSACGRRVPEQPRSPAGTFAVIIADGWMISVGRGRPSPEGLGADWRVTIAFRADGTFSYEWRNPKDADGAVRRIEGTWRPDEANAPGFAPKWRMVVAGEPDRSEVGPPSPRHIIFWSGESGWWLPALDPATGRLLDSFWLVGISGEQ